VYNFIDEFFVLLVTNIDYHRHVFNIAVHMDHVDVRSLDSFTCLKLRKVYREAIHNTKASGAYESTKKYCEAAIKLLPDDPWTEDIYDEVCKGAST